MKKNLFIVIFIFCAAFGIFAQKTVVKSDADIKKEIIKLEDENNRAVVAGDGKSIGNLYADDFLGFDAAGGTNSRTTLMDYYSINSSKLSVSEETEIRVFDKTVVVTAITKYKSNEADDLNIMRYVRVYVFRNKKWQIVSEQYTFVGNNTNLSDDETMF